MSELRIGCIGDTHLGAATDLRAVPPGRAGSRLEEQETALRDAVEGMLANGCQMILHAGDVFHRRKPTPAEYMAWRRAISPAAGRARMLVIDGNHDRGALDGDQALDVIAQGFLTRVAEPKVVVYPTWMGTRVEVACLPWTPVSGLVASQNGRAGVYEQAVEALLATARGLRAEIAERRATELGASMSILLLHWSVTGAVTPGGQSTAMFHEPVLPAGELQAMGWDAIVCGHIHKWQRLGALVEGDEYPFFYTGSLPMVDWSEDRTWHGYTVLAEGGYTRYAVEDARYVTVDIDYQDPVLPSAVDVREATVRLRVRAPVEDTTGWVEQQKQALMDLGVAGFAQVRVEVERRVKSRIRALDDSLLPVQAARMWAVENEQDADMLARRTAEYVERVE